MVSKIRVQNRSPREETGKCDPFLKDRVTETDPQRVQVLGLAHVTTMIEDTMENMLEMTENYL